MDDFVSAGPPKASSSAGEPSTDRKLTTFTSTSTLSHKKQTSKKSSSAKGPKPTRTVNGMEDVFSHAQVRTWSEVRIKTWEHRRTNVEGFYYRFVGKSFHPYFVRTRSSSKVLNGNVCNASNHLLLYNFRSYRGTAEWTMERKVNTGVYGQT